MERMLLEVTPLCGAPKFEAWLHVQLLGSRGDFNRACREQTSKLAV